MKNRFLYLLIMFMTVACSKDNEYNFKTIESFPINEELVGEVTKLDTMPNCPKSIFTTGKYLVLYSRTCDKKLVHVYNKFTYKLIGSFGTIGKGPNDEENNSLFFLTDNDEGFPQIIRYRIPHSLK